MSQVSFRRMVSVTMIAVFAVCEAHVSFAAGAAAPSSKEDAAIRRGLDLRRQRKDEQALQEFQNAYAAGKSTRALAQIGLAEQALGRWPEAEAHVTEAIGNPQDPWIKKNQEVLRSALAEIQRHLGSLEVTGQSGAEVLVNGQSLGTLPFARPARVPIGTLNVEVRKSGFLPSTRPVSISPGMLARENIGLQMAPTAAPPMFAPQASPVSRAVAGTGAADAPGGSAAAPFGPPGSHAAAEQPADRQEQGEQQGPDQGGSWRRPAAWGAAAGAVLSSGVGIAALVLRNGKIGDANQLTCNVSNGTVAPADPANRAKCLDLANSASRMGVVAIASFSVAGALAIGSVILFATAPSSARGDGALACGPALFQPGAFCRLTF